MLLVRRMERLIHIDETKQVQATKNCVQLLEFLYTLSLPMG